MLQGPCQQDLLYFSLQRDEAGAIIMKKLRLSVNVPCPGHSLFNSRLRIWTRFHGAVHNHLHNGGHIVSSKTFSRSQIEYIMVLPGPRALLPSSFPLTCFWHSEIKEFILCMTLSNQSLANRHCTGWSHKNQRATLFPSRSLYSRAVPTKRSTLWATKQATHGNLKIYICVCIHVIVKNT